MTLKIPYSEIALKIDQTLTQDATGTMVMLELEAMGLDIAKTEASAQYVDHNLVQTDSKNADDQNANLYYSGFNTNYSNIKRLIYFIQQNIISLYSRNAKKDVHR